jgi:hypothetical protein
MDMKYLLFSLFESLASTMLVLKDPNLGFNFTKADEGKAA